MASIKYVRLRKIGCALAVLFAILTMTACGRPSTTSGSPNYVRKSPPYIGNKMRQEEYDSALLEQWVDMDAFISAEMLESRFGNLKYIYFAAEMERIGTSSGYVPKKIITESYVYCFDEDRGGKYDVILRIEKLGPDGNAHYLPKPLASIASPDIDPNDLRKATCQGTYWIGDIGYTYWHDEENNIDKLASIRWKGNGYAFLLETSGVDDGSFITQLLREETAKETIAEFNRDISRKLFWGKVYRNWLPWIVPAVILVSGLTVFVLIRCRRKKKAAAAAVPAEEPAIEKEE